MSFKTKTIILLLTVSLAPLIATIFFLVKAYHSDVEQRLISDMNYKLEITLSRLEQELTTLENDLTFISSLDIMNDLITGDFDKRISELLVRKKKDLNLIGDFYAFGTDSTIIASSNYNKIGTRASANYFRKIPVYSTFSNQLIGTLAINYDLKNLSRLFINDDNSTFYLIDLENDSSSLAPDNQKYLSVRGALSNLPQLSVLLRQDKAQTFAALNRLTRNFYIALLLGGILIAIIALLIANYILNPILNLSSTAKKITSTEDYTLNVEVGRNDEIGELAHSFNQMISSIHQMLIRLEEESRNKIKLAQERDRAEMLQSLSTKLSKYLSPQIYESIFKGEKDVILSSSRKKLTIFFSDIVGFTSTADQMESEDLTLLINHYLKEMTDIALKYGATIDKYIGDAIMIFFGDPYSDGIEVDARRCVEMAIMMQKRVRELQHEWKTIGYTKPFNIRVGIHTAYCTVGNFGTENRMDYTIIGSGVNLASRIESNSEPGEIYISEDTFLLVNQAFNCQPAHTITPKGFSNPVQLYKVDVTSSGKPDLEVNDKGIQLNIDSELVTSKLVTQLQTWLDQFKKNN